MKIAIQSNKPRGKEIISLLESLGGNNKSSNTIKWAGNSSNPMLYYYIGKNGYIQLDPCPKDYKPYTLEQFEKEFPFKVGDEVIALEDQKLYKIIAFEYYNDELCYKLNNSFHYKPQALKLYKETKEERNITLTFDKAKEWYNKGGELKEIALQAFSEKELNPLPKSWKEYCMTYGCICLSARYTKISTKYDALLKLEQLRDCWRQGWIPDYTKTYKKFRIKKLGTEYIVDWSTGLSDFLVFQTEELAKEFLKCFRDLIEEAGDLI